MLSAPPNHGRLSESYSGTWCARDHRWELYEVWGELDPKTQPSGQQWEPAVEARPFADALWHPRARVQETRPQGYSKRSGVEQFRDLK